ncbi:MAG: putative chromosome-partitioning protein ParB [Bacteroidia bacterium]|nr:putative chromosome-partitioning protein ParB [Bacteroidia bacterium]
MNNNKKSALGRGLSALLEDAGTDITTGIDSGSTSKVAGGVSTIPISSIEINPFQPRTHFEQQALEELSASIKSLGVIQPITVRKMGHDKYQIISGERRFRASQLAGLKEIPAFIRIANDQSMLEMALVENIQREDLDAIEIAISYQRLVEEVKLTQEELSERVGKQRSTVANYLRLLKLPPEIQLAIRDKKISMGHARTLINIEDPAKQKDAFNQIIEKELSVREVEDVVRGLKKQVKKTAPAPKLPLSFELQKINEDLSRLLEAKVKLKSTRAGNGTITIQFNSERELKNILSKFEL